ncbi:hypothetical protein [Candidatus Ichthyocystis sparus]|uniref:hypothetical protein n=1 Tax=Candidatus Ichthyocystis sparus TaxID=1561004 RepID=UPI000B8868E6|nr:hypothetical protein [Candidatus Ichthyocystis sparus]
MSAARESPPPHEQKEPSVAIKVVGVGPRRTRGPGSNPVTIKKRSEGTDIRLCDMLSVSLVIVLVFAVLVYDLLTLEDSDTTSGEDSNAAAASGRITGFSRSFLASIAPNVFIVLLMLSALFVGVISSRRRKSKREDEQWYNTCVVVIVVFLFSLLCRVISCVCCVNERFNALRVCVVVGA